MIPAPPPFVLQHLQTKQKTVNEKNLVLNLPNNIIAQLGFVNTTEINTTFKISQKSDLILMVIFIS